MKKSMLLLIMIILFSSINIYSFNGENPFGMNATLALSWWGGQHLYEWRNDSQWNHYSRRYRSLIDTAYNHKILWWRVLYAFEWDNVEDSQGNFNFGDEDSIVKWTSEKKMFVLPTLGGVPRWAHNPNIPASDSVYWTSYIPNPADIEYYKEYINSVVERYDGDGKNDAPIGHFIPIKYWEFMNEPYCKYFLGTMEDYENMFKMTYTAIKRADSTAKILAPCFSSTPSWMAFGWQYYNTDSGYVVNSYYGTPSDTQNSEERLINFLRFIKQLISDTSYTFDINDLVISHHLYQRDANLSFRYLRSVLSIVDSIFPGEEIPVWITEIGYPSKIDIDIHHKDFVFDTDENGYFIIHDSIRIHSFPDYKLYVTDTVLIPGDSIVTPSGDTISFNGGSIIDTNNDTVLAIGDSVNLYHYYLRDTVLNSDTSVISTESTQANNYKTIIDSIFMHPDIAKRVKLFFFGVNKAWKFSLPTFSEDSSSGNIKLYIRDSYNFLSPAPFKSGTDTPVILRSYDTIRDNAPARLCNDPTLINTEFQDSLIYVTWKNNSFNNIGYNVTRIIYDSCTEDTSYHNAHHDTTYISLAYLPYNAESYTDTLIHDTIINKLTRYLISAIRTDGLWAIGGSDYWFPGDTTIPYINIQSPLNPDIAGDYYTLHWQASDTISAIKSQKLILDNDTINLNKDIRQYKIQKGIYNGWYTILPKLEVEDYGRNCASDSDSVRVALFDGNDKDIRIELFDDLSRSRWYPVSLRYTIPETGNYKLYYYENVFNKKWESESYTFNNTSGEIHLFYAPAECRILAFLCRENDNRFIHYSNITSLLVHGGITPLPKLFSNNGNKYILEYELFTPDRTDNTILLRNNVLIGNNFKFRIINNDKNTFIDNIKLYAIDSKKDINLNDTKDEIDTTYIKSIRTELEQESLDSRLNSIDEKYYILKPNDTLDFTFRNINRELSKGYTRDYVMEITGYQGDVISAGIAKRKKELNNDVRMIRSVGSSLEIEFSSIRKREINLKVCDLSGRIVRNEKIMLDKGRKSYQIKSLPLGIYLIQANRKSFKGIILK